MDQEKSSLISITKRTQILIILFVFFCTLSCVIFILIHQLVIPKEGESILSFFLEKEHDPLSSPTEIIDYLKWSTESTCKNQVYFGGPLFEQPSPKLTLFEGQKAVCLDEKVASEVNNCLVYSFGIRNDWYFEESMEENQGCNVSFFQIKTLRKKIKMSIYFQVYSFDHLMGKIHYDHSKLIHFYPIALGREDKAESENEPWETKTLSSIYEMLSTFHGENAIIDYLKINPVEDLAVLTQLVDSGILKRVRQLSLKIIVPSEMEEDQEYLNEIAKVLQRIGNEGEMVRFSSRVNYFSNRKSNGKMSSYSAYELVWFNFGKLYGTRSPLPRIMVQETNSLKSADDDFEKSNEDNQLNIIDDVAV